MSEFKITGQTVGLIINTPAFFQRPDFIAWLTSPDRSTATWHKPGEEPHDYSDVFVLVDGNYEGDSSDMPEDLWRQICGAAYDTYCGGQDVLPAHITNHIVVRLTNLEA
jgi:hypothetical protein